MGLAVTCDSTLSFNQHIEEITMAKMSPFLSMADAEIQLCHVIALKVIKVLLVMHKIISRLAPLHLFDLINPCIPPRALLAQRPEFAPRLNP